MNYHINIYRLMIINCLHAYVHATQLKKSIMNPINESLHDE